MKRTILGLALAGTAAACADVSFSNVSVRQLWPFSRDVVVDYVAAGVNGIQQVRVTAFDGDTRLGEIPAAAFRADSTVRADGAGRLAFDPSKAPALKARGIAKDFRVSLSAVPVPADDLLYVVFDLTKTPGQPGQETWITAEALTNGVWGTWERRFWPKGEDAVCWTGVTNDTKYALTHLVMRRIPAGAFRMGSPADEVERAQFADFEFLQREVTLTQPYYIGVYPITCKQYRLMSGSTNTAELDMPSHNDSWMTVRGSNAWPGDAPSPSTVLGKLRVRTGWPLDFPTEAQWEKAARAGADGVYYDGDMTGTHLAPRITMAWCSNNSQGWRHTVGQLKPNNYGLYDMLGNVFEFTLDWMGDKDSQPTLTDPVGPAAEQAGYEKQRVVKGGAFFSDYFNVRLALRAGRAVDAASTGYGWRVAMPASK